MPDPSNPEISEAEVALLKRHPLPHKIFLPTEKYSGQERIKGIQKVVDLYESKRLETQFGPSLRELRKKFENRERCFIIGNGPSLNHTNLDYLKNEITFGLNGIFLKFQEMQFTPTFYLVEDHLVAEDRAERINTLAGSIKLFPAYLAYCIDEGPDVFFVHHRHRNRSREGNYDFSTDASKLTYAGCTVTFTAIQLAYFFGFKKIYLVGVDCNYEIPKDVATSLSYGTATLDMKSDDVNHFHPDYFGKGFRWHDPQVDRMICAYEEAHRVCLENGVQVFNATKGGKLETFPRVSYDDLFRPDQAERANLDQPRVLMVDLTAIGSDSATGQLKETLFGDWPADKLLQIFRYKQRKIHILNGFGDVERAKRLETVEDAVAAARLFRPEVIYCRPLDACPELMQVLLRLSREDGIPLVVHMMDDWPDRYREAEPFKYPKVDALLRELLADAAACLSISDVMSREFELRYGRKFEAIANSVHPRNWPEIEKTVGEKFVIRYCGGLFDDMARASVMAVAECIQQLNTEHGFKIRLEIYTVANRFEEAVEELQKIPAVEVFPLVPREQYPKLLITADALLLAYNSDPATIRYLKYSMANKLPECLASGSVILALGPVEISTLQYLRSTGCALVAGDIGEFRQNLKEMIEDRDRRIRIGRAARCYVFQNHHINRDRARFGDILARAANQAPSKQNLLLGPYLRKDLRNFDEVAAIRAWFDKMGIARTGLVFDPALFFLKDKARSLLMQPETLDSFMARLRACDSSTPAEMEGHFLFALDRNTTQSGWLESIVCALRDRATFYFPADFANPPSVNRQVDPLLAILVAAGYHIFYSRWFGTGASNFGREVWRGLEDQGSNLHRLAGVDAILAIPAPGREPFLQGIERFVRTIKLPARRWLPPATTRKIPREPKGELRRRAWIVGSLLLTLAVVGIWYSAAHALALILLAWIGFNFFLKQRRASHRVLVRLNRLEALAGTPQGNAEADHPDEIPEEVLCQMRREALATTLELYHSLK